MKNFYSKILLVVIGVILHFTSIAGVFVTDKSIDGFKVKELAKGISNVKFSWHIVANRADDIDSLGNVTSKHVGLRLPYGPIAIKETQMIKKEIKNTNSISMN